MTLQKNQIEQKIFDREFGFVSTWTKTVGVSRCLNDGGWLQKLTGEYHFDLVESVKEFSYFRFNIWKLQELIKNGGVNESNDIDVEMHFEIPSKVKDVEIIGITSLAENIKQIEFRGKVYFPNENLSCFENPIPFSSVIAARKYDDGWRLYQIENTNHLD